MRQSKEESQALWTVELDSAKQLDLTEEHASLIELVTAKINDYSLTYDEYVQDIHDYLEKVTDGEPKQIVKDMCNFLIEKYNGEEIRSEQN